MDKRPVNLFLETNYFEQQDLQAYSIDALPEDERDVLDMYQRVSNDSDIKILFHRTVGLSDFVQESEGTTLAD